MKTTSLIFCVLLLTFFSLPVMCFADGENGDSEPEDPNIEIKVEDEEEGEDNDDKTENYPHRGPGETSSITGVYYSSSGTLMLSVPSSMTTITRITISLNNQTVVNDMSPLPATHFYYYMDLTYTGIYTVSIYTSSGKIYQGLFMV